MINLSVGCNFDLELIDFVSQLNRNSPEVFISELYGSIREHQEFTARPSFRLPDISLKEFEKFIKKCDDEKLRFNYTLNTLYPGSKKNTVFNNKLISLVKYLIDIGVNNITIANPIIAEILRNKGININLSISTIAHIDSVTQIKIWHQTYKIKKIYGNILKNRSIKFLINASKYCQKNSIELCLIANEFCGNGTISNDEAFSSTHCIFRDSCFLIHAENQTLEDDELLNGYPMNHCINSRNNIETWLKTMFIRPEDLRKYKGIGISSFKITGRTGSTEYLKKIIEAYAKEDWSGNLIALWKPLETIRTKENELTFKHPLFIDNKKLDGFIDYWFNNIDHECSNEICGETCKYCNNYAKKKTAPNKGS